MSTGALICIFFLFHISLPWTNVAREQSTRQALGPTEICFVMRPPQMQPLSLVQVSIQV